MSFAVAMTDSLEAVLRDHLVRPDGQEDLCFALWRPSNGKGRQSALLSRVLLPEQVGDRRVHGNASFSSAYLDRALREAAREAGGVALLHSHPGRGWQGLSRDDRAAEGGMAGAIKASTGLPLVGLTLAAGDGNWSARSWRRAGRQLYVPDFADTVRIVGEALRLQFYDDLLPRPHRRPSQACTIDAWGPDVQASFGRVRVGVIGLGSVGSVVAEALARMGVARFVLMDFDRLDTRNLDRTLHAYPRDVGRGKARLAEEAIRKSATASSVDVFVSEHSVCEPDGFTLAQDCDVIFSCVDRPWPRSVLNHLAFGHLIPVIDGGILVMKTRSGRMRGAHWKAHTVTHGRRCLQCLGQYRPCDVALDQEGHLDDPSYIEALPPGHVLRSSQNVFPFTLAAASLEVLQFVCLVAAPGGNSLILPQNYHLSTGWIDQLQGPEALCEADCPFPGMTGMGDHGPHPGTARHTVAERRRTVSVRSLGSPRRSRNGARTRHNRGPGESTSAA